jgi:sulfatase maturation enzyme AslB (radical SAM superfamily)
VTDDLARMLATACGIVQVSLDRPEILDGYRGRGSAERALAALRRIENAGGRTGVNLLLVPENIGNISESLDWLLGQRVTRIVLLRPFGDSGGRWAPGWPKVQDWVGLRRELGRWTRSAPDAVLEIACGMSLVLSDVPWEERRRRLAMGCSGARRFISMRADGTLWPCSHLAAPSHCLGHVLRNSVNEVWAAGWGGPPPEELVCPAAPGIGIGGTDPLR